MLLFESDAWGTILHTGDCRVGPSQLEALCSALDEHLGEGGHRRIDLLFMDATAAGVRVGGVVVEVVWGSLHAVLLCLFGVCNL